MFTSSLIIYLAFASFSLAQVDVPESFWECYCDSWGEDDVTGVPHDCEALPPKIVFTDFDVAGECLVQSPVICLGGTGGYHGLDHEMYLDAGGTTDAFLLLDVLSDKTESRATLQAYFDAGVDPAEYGALGTDEERSLYLKSFAETKGLAPSESNTNLVDFETCISNFVTVNLKDSCRECISNLLTGSDTSVGCMNIYGTNTNDAYGPTRACGMFQLTEDYWLGCGQLLPPTPTAVGFEDCARDEQCSKDCVKVNLETKMTEKGKSCYPDQTVYFDCEQYAAFHLASLGIDGFPDIDECDGGTTLKFDDAGDKQAMLSHFVTDAATCFSASLTV